MPNTDLPPQEEYSYSMPPACQINLSINLTELPKCTKDGCDGHFAPFQWTSRPNSGYATVMCSAWACLNCGTNIMYSNGKLITQSVLMDVNAQL
jgi:hypothetical protein